MRYATENGSLYAPSGALWPPESYRRPSDVPQFVRNYFNAMGDTWVDLPPLAFEPSNLPDPSSSYGSPVVEIPTARNSQPGAVTLPPELSPFSFTPSDSVTLPSLSEPNNNLSLGGDTSSPLSLTDFSNDVGSFYQSPSVSYEHPNDNWTALPSMYLDSGISEGSFNGSGTPSLLNFNTSFDYNDIPYTDFSPSFQMMGTNFDSEPASQNLGGTDIQDFGGDLSLGGDLPSYHDYETTPVSFDDLPNFEDSLRTTDPIWDENTEQPEWMANANSRPWENNATSIEPWRDNAVSNPFDISRFAPDLPNWSDSLRTPLASFNFGGFGDGGYAGSVNRAGTASYATLASLGLSPGISVNVPGASNYLSGLGFNPFAHPLLAT